MPPFGSRKVGKIVANVHPHVRFLFVEMAAQRCYNKEMSVKSGIASYTFWDWRNRTEPKISDLEACLNVLGYTLKVVPLPEPGKGIAIHPKDCECGQCIKTG